MRASKDRPNILRRRWECFEGQLDLDPERLVFIDETWGEQPKVPAMRSIVGMATEGSTNLAHCHGRCRRGERLRASVPHGHWKTTTFVAGLRRTGMIAPMVLDGPIKRDAFHA